MLHLFEKYNLTKIDISGFELVFYAKLTDCLID